MTGPEMAELFYQQELFTRKKAAPGRIKKTLFGQGGVQGLDGEAHRHRKEMFMSLMNPERIKHLKTLVADEWHAHTIKWAQMDKIVLYDEVQKILTRAVCKWVGISLPESEVNQRTAQLKGMFEYAGSVGPRHWWSRFCRKRSEQWIEDVVKQVRAGHQTSPEDSLINIIATWRDLDNELLSPNIAAVELLNILRPVVAISVFITLSAHALHRFPSWHQKLQDDDESLEFFIQEVRRFYPFFPAVMARVRKDFEWNNYKFSRGKRVLLDIYGTNRDSRTWNMPEEFQPERFKGWDGSPFNFIPHGGGDYHSNHRCPGEWITIELMKVSCRFLLTNIDYSVPDQDMKIDKRKLPALPKSRFVMSNVKLRG
tara:strand:- start:1085 stop:2191 length:1107 start_codon:yes stop_codon:yes gene_type:complete